MRFFVFFCLVASVISFRLPRNAIPRAFNLMDITEAVGAGGIEEGGFYSIGPRKNKAPITEDAVVVLPPPSRIERGYSDAKAAMKRAAQGFKEGPFTKAEDDLIRKMVAEDAGGRGRWVRIAKALGRHEQHVLYRWTQVLEEKTHKPEYKDIIHDSAYGAKN
jgi:hypothetical protein